RAPGAGSASARPRVVTQYVFVHVSAASGRGGNHERAVSDLRDSGGQRLPPRHVVDIDLEDTNVRYRRAPLGGDEGCEVAVVVVRSAVHLEGLSQIGDLLRLVEAVPDNVDGGNVHCAHLEVRPEAA